jgi:hypothetical protein
LELFADATVKDDEWRAKLMSHMLKAEEAEERRSAQKRSSASSTMMSSGMQSSFKAASQVTRQDIRPANTSGGSKSASAASTTSKSVSMTAASAKLAPQPPPPPPPAPPALNPLLRQPQLKVCNLYEEHFQRFSFEILCLVFVRDFTHQLAITTSYRSTILGKIIDAFVKQGTAQAEAEQVAAAKELEIAQKAEVRNHFLEIITSFFVFECQSLTR